MDQDTLPPSFDYLEVVFTGTAPDPQNPSQKPLVSQQVFDKMLARMQDARAFQSDHKEYILENLTMTKKIEDGTVKETKVYQAYPVAIQDHPGFRVIFYHKKKLTTIAFPSTKTFDDVKYKRRLTYRINNRVYVNFQIEKHEHAKPTPTYPRVYINFNSSKDADLKESVAAINTIIHKLLA